MTHLRQFEWTDDDAVVAIWAAAAREVVPRAELEAKLTRDPELFVMAETRGTLSGVVMGTQELGYLPCPMCCAPSRWGESASGQDRIDAGATLCGNGRGRAGCD